MFWAKKLLNVYQGMTQFDFMVVLFSEIEDASEPKANEVYKFYEITYE